MGTLGSPIRSLCHRARLEHTFDTTASAFHNLFIDLMGTGAHLILLARTCELTDSSYDLSVFTTTTVDLFDFVWPFSSELWSWKPPLKQASFTPYG